MPPLPILALAVASFGIGTTEFVIMGLLPEVARSFGVTIPQAGYLVSGYAHGRGRWARRSWRSPPRGCRARARCSR